MIVQSAGALKSFGDTPPGAPVIYSGRSLDNLSASTYASIYRTQPNVRTVVDFLAQAVAQLSLHAFRRVSDLDRERLSDYELINWIEKNPATTRYRLFENLMKDLGIYFNAYWLKVRADGSLRLLRLPPEEITVSGWLLPNSLIWDRPDGSRHQLAMRDVVTFNGYDPADPLMGLSPLETLRQLLAEDSASTAFRKAFWTNSARLEGVIERPATAPRWTADQKRDFREQWQQRFVGAHNAGQTAVLEDGMSFKQTSYSARDSEFVSARKLTREEVAAAYHVPQPMVGILDHATYSNVKEQHKQLYQDTLGPWLEWIQEELERQLLPDCDDIANVYLEFNIADKLKGSFEEQSQALFQLVGRPIMTANEGRARLNLSSMKDDPSADALAMPLNTGSGATSVDPAAPADGEPTGNPPALPSLSAVEAARVAPILRAHRARVQGRLQRAPTDRRAEVFFADFDRCVGELADDLTPLLGAKRGRDVALDRSVAFAVELENV